MSNSKRALRRHHRERLNRRTAWILINTRWISYNDNDEDLWYRVNRRRDNMQVCSCRGCCNGRNKRSWSKQWKRLSLQEVRQLYCEQAQWDEVDKEIGL